jgi:hypothetical protein
LLELVQNFVRQTDGFIGVASLHAVFKRYMQLAHRLSLFSWQRIITTDDTDFTDKQIKIRVIRGSCLS